MHVDDAGELLIVRGRAVVFVQIGMVLEIVGVQAAVGHGRVDQRIIGIDHDFQREALFGHVVLDELKDFGVGHRGGADLDGLALGEYRGAQARA